MKNATLKTKDRCECPSSDPNPSVQRGVTLDYARLIQSGIALEACHRTPNSHGLPKSQCPFGVRRQSDSDDGALAAALVYANKPKAAN